MCGLVETLTSQKIDSATPIRTPASTPKTRAPSRAATATPKSNRLTRNRRLISGRSIIPMTTASMMIAASTGFGRPEKSGARSSRVSRTANPMVSEASPDLAPEWSLSELADRLVETGIPWRSPAPVLANP